MIRYTDGQENVTADQLQGFFVGWPHPPSAETHLKILHNSDHVVLAWDDSRVVGFVNAVSDNTLCAYLPLLEVLPAYQGQGIGKELMQRMLERLKGLYMIDLVCDADLQPFYERFGMRAMSAMIIRDFEHQNGHETETE